MLLTDFHGYDTMRDNFGQSLVMVLAVTVGINFFRLIMKSFGTVRELFLKFRKLLYLKFGWFKDQVMTTVAIKPMGQTHNPVNQTASRFERTFSNNRSHMDFSADNDMIMEGT